MKWSLYIAVTLLSFSFHSCQQSSKQVVGELLTENPSSTVTNAENTPGKPQKVEFISQYDQTPLSYSIVAPSGKSEILLIVLSSWDEFTEPLENTFAWQVYIPSRPYMNYRFFAEGDFWNILEDCYKLYPQLRDYPHVIVGTNASADAAMSIANAYPMRFAGLAVSGPLFSFDWKNLDNMPIVSFYAPLTRPDIPFATAEWIQYLQSRGNFTANEVRGPLTEALPVLFKDLYKTVKTHHVTFFDYQYANMSPWAQVLSKQSDYDSADVSTYIDEDTFVINTSNISQFRIYKYIFKNPAITSLRYNGKLVAFNFQNDSMILGESSPLDPSKSKAFAPSGYGNFFRNDPLFIVYQDQELPIELLEKVRSIASKLSHLNLAGFPKSLIMQIPMIPLSEYDPNKQPVHRAIFIGNEAVKRVISNNALDYPLEIHPGELILNQRIERDISNTFENYAYGMNFPPIESSPLKLAFLLIAQDLDGFNTLENYYCSAMALFDSVDVKIWLSEGGTYHIAMEKMFSSYWDSTHKSTALIKLPRNTHEVWDQFLQELIIDNTHMGAFILPPLTNTSSTPPELLKTEKLEEFISDRHFATITLSAPLGTYMGNILLNKILKARVVGLDAVTKFDSAQNTYYFDEQELLQKKSVSLLVDVGSLLSFTRKELKTLNAQIFPHSLHEMLIKQIKKSPQDLAKTMIRLGNESETFVR